MLAAWNAAGWTAQRMAGQRPDLPDILADEPAPSGPQPPAIMRELMLQWATRCGLAIEHHDSPVN